MNGLVLVVAATLSAEISPILPAEACHARLEASLEEMESRPILKEEQATGLMWLRMDATRALSEGKPQVCHDLMDRVDLILNVETHPDRLK